MNVPAWRMSCLCADCPPSRSGCALPRPCTSRSLETALSSQLAAAAEGQFGKWHVRGRKDGPECRGGRGFGCLWQYRYHMLRVSPETAWVVWIRAVNRSSTAAKILYCLYQSQTDLNLPQLHWKEILS